MAHVAPYKKQLVENLATRCAQARVVGIANIHGIPAPQFQAIRKKLTGRATITVAKNKSKLVESTWRFARGRRRLSAKYIATLYARWQSNVVSAKAVR